MGRAPIIQKHEQKKPKKKDKEEPEELEEEAPQKEVKVEMSTFSLANYDLNRPEHDYKKLVAQMKHLCYQQDQGDKMEIDIYCDMYKEWVKHMQHLGSCVSMGFKDLEDKRLNILDNREYYLELGLISTAHEEFRYLKDTIDFEIKTELHLVDWGMNKEHLEKAYKHVGLRQPVEDDFEIEGYWSTCQTIVVGEWFFLFLSHLYQEYTTTDKSMAELGKYCYQEVLAHRHNWFLRTAANLALNLINSREAFEESLLKGFP